MTESIPSSNRKRARRKHCQVCGCPYHQQIVSSRAGGIVHFRPAVVREVVDHLIPRSYLRGKTRKSPHVLLNLVSVCNLDHGRKLSAEKALHRGDWLGFCGILFKLGWPLDLVDTAAKYYGL